MPASQFPAYAIKDALVLAQTIATQNAGQRMRRLDVFDHLKKSPESGPSRSLVTASSGYGLTKGGYTAEYLELEARGRRAVIDSDPKALVEAVMSVEVFKRFFEKYRNSQFPSETPAKSFLAENGVPVERTEQCLKMIRANGEFTGLIRNLSGADRIVSPEAAVPESRVPAATTHSSPPPAVALSKDGARLASVNIPSLNINLEIHLPAEASPQTYDAIFKGIREHLINAETTD